MDTYITRESLQAILNKLDIDSAIDDEGLVGAGFPSGETVFIIDDTLVTARTNWYGIIPDHKKQEIEEFINSTNARVPVGKLIPVVMAMALKRWSFGCTFINRIRCLTHSYAKFLMPTFSLPSTALTQCSW